MNRMSDSQTSYKGRLFLPKFVIIRNLKPKCRLILQIDIESSLELIGRDERI